MIVCPNCGKENADESVHCGFCGHQLKEGDKSKSKTMFGMSAISADEVKKATQTAKEASQAAAGGGQGSAQEQANSGASDGPPKLNLPKPGNLGGGGGATTAAPEQEQDRAEPKSPQGDPFAKTEAMSPVAQSDLAEQSGQNQGGGPSFQGANPGTSQSGQSGGNDGPSAFGDDFPSPDESTGGPSQQSGGWNNTDPNSSADPGQGQSSGWENAGSGSSQASGQGNAHPDPGSINQKPPTEPGIPDDGPTMGFDAGAGPRNNPPHDPVGAPGADQALAKGDPGRAMQNNPHPTTSLDKKKDNKKLIIGAIAALFVFGCIGLALIAFLISKFL